MKVHRFFIHDEPVGDRYVIQIPEVVHQITRVLRLTKGESIALVVGGGLVFIAEITELERSYVGVRITETQQAWVPSIPITVFLAAIRKERFEWALEKCTELGVASIVPLVTSRTERGVVPVERAARIMQEAAEQCGRGDVPVLGEPMKLEEVLSPQNAMTIVCDMGGDTITLLSKKIHAARTVHILIGPEGGWNDDERDRIHRAGVSVLSLGHTVLRAETAAVAACALVQSVL